MAIAPGIAFSHVGIHVTDLEGMERFYTRLIGRGRARVVSPEAGR